MARPDLSLISTIVGSCLVGLSTLPAYCAIWRRGRLRKATTSSHQAVHELYQDEDGTATEESSNAFSDRIHRGLIGFLVLAGLLISLVLPVYSTAVLGSRTRDVELWLYFAAWSLLLVQAVALFAEPSSTKRYTLGLHQARSCIFILIMIPLGVRPPSPNVDSERNIRTFNCLTIGQVVIAVLVLFLSISLPRRPDVFRNGKVVDQQFTNSWLGRLTFKWADPLLRYAAKNRGLKIDDLPELDHATRSKTLLEQFEAHKKDGERLWKTLFRVYAVPLATQLILSAIYSISTFAPQYCLLKILRYMEVRTDASWNLTQGWVWVALLGGSVLFTSVIEAWLFWLVYYQLSLPIYEQISAVVFAKSMRRKDVKGSQKVEGEADGSKKAGKNDPFDDEEDEDARKTRQATINLVAVDAKRVADFAAYNNIILNTIIKLTLTVIFLSRLIGWKSLGAGFLVSAIITPLNIIVAKKYTNTQVSLMKYRDQKMAVINEVLQGIRQVKFSALESRWENKIWEVRNVELDTQWSAFKYDVILIALWIIGPIMLSAVSLAVYSLLHGKLSPSVAFTTISVFTAMEFSLAILPELIADFIEAWVSVERIGKYLESPERVETTIPSNFISFEKATVAWAADNQEENPERFMLQDININFPPNALSVISGKTGSGKSLLLAAILGESDIIEGSVHVPVAPPLEDRFDDRATKANWIIGSAIAFVAQVPWIENASIKDNILFGLPFDEERYNKVIFACALEKDFEMLVDGELTDIGANGINLSGGQKWRVSFARALYSRAGILILDDIFSALDAHTGRHLHVHALTGELCQGRTRILVTHHVGLCLDQTDYSVHLDGGVVQHAGSVEELKRTGSLADILAQDDNGETEEADDDVEEQLQAQWRPVNATQKTPSPTNMNGQTGPKKETPKQFQQDEKRETGSIKLNNYKKYLQSGGSISYWIAVSFTFALAAAIPVARSWWVTVWTRSGKDQPPEKNLDLMFHVANKTTAPSSEHSLWFYLGIYVGLSILSCVFSTIRYGFFLSAAIQASRNLFRNLTYTVLRAPLRWLDTVPVGRILNRFTADFNQVDSRLPYDFAFMVYNVLEVFGIIVAATLVSPLIIIFAVSLLLISLYYSNLYLAGAREIKRLESNAKSPVYEQFGSALIGLGTIRAFGKAQTYVERMYVKIDKHAQAYWNMWLFNRWLGFRMYTVGTIFTVVMAAFIVSMKGIDAALAGFALSFALQYSAVLTWSLRRYANVELAMNATERVLEFSAIDTEDQGGRDAPAAWPTEGRLEVSDLVVGYAPDLPAVLQGLSFTVEKNQRVGVVGRTGAGKSSLTLALFRFLEPRSGSIYIDGIDVTKIKLHDLRSRLAIIPQDPVLFSGTVRSNLDPFNEYSDEELRDALERVHLVSGSSTFTTNSNNNSQPVSGISTPTVNNDPSIGSSSTETVQNTNINIFKSLDSTISEGGLNLSQGQRQLLCLARAIVSRPKIMVLDEATSAVDMDTDALIQQSIRSEFGRNSTTLLVIAHRLSTIADFDRILVMDAGKAVEFGSPKDLMGIEGGVFKSLVQESGERETLEKTILG